MSIALRLSSALAMLLLLAGCNTPPGEPKVLVPEPEKLYFSEDECKSLETALRLGGVYFALEAGLEGFEMTDLQRKAFSQRLAELFWKQSKAMVWTVRVEASTAQPGQRLVIPAFVWGDDPKLTENTIRIAARSSHQLVTPYINIPPNTTLGLSLALHYTDKAESNIAERLTEIIKLGVVMTGAVPGTHSVAAMFTSGVADRIDGQLSTFFSDVQKPAFQPIDLIGARLDTGAKCTERQIGVRYRINNPLLPKGTATIEVKTVFQLSKFALARKDGLPDYEGSSLKKLEDATLLIAEAVQRNGNAETAQVTHYAAEFLTRTDTIVPQWQSFVTARDVVSLTPICESLKVAARDKVFLNKADRIALIAFLYRYRLDAKHLQAGIKICLGDDYDLLTKMNFSPKSLESADPGPAADRLLAALTEYGKPRTTGQFAAWTKLSNELQPLLSSDSVTFYEFVRTQNSEQLLKRTDGTPADGILQKDGDGAFGILESILREKFACSVNVATAPGARWYQVEPKSDAIGSVTRIHLTEYLPKQITNSPRDCYARLGGAG